MFHRISLKRLSVVTSSLILCLGGVMGTAASASVVPVNGAGGAAAPSSVHFGGTTPNCDGDDTQIIWSSPFSYTTFVRSGSGDFVATLYTT